MSYEDYLDYLIENEEEAEELQALSEWLEECGIGSDLTEEEEEILITEALNIWFSEDELDVDVNPKSNEALEDEMLDDPSGTPSEDGDAEDVVPDQGDEVPGDAEGDASDLIGADAGDEADKEEVDNPIEGNAIKEWVDIHNILTQL